MRLLLLKRIACWICIVFFAYGCSTASPKTSAVQPATSDKLDILRPSADPSKAGELSKDVEQDTKQPPVVKKGIVFGKTEFRGVLKTDYVELFLADIAHPDHKYRLHLGNGGGKKKDGDALLTYFSMELPEGQYVISRISIPVGTTKAVEDIKITFNVVSDKVTYLGTLKAVGTKETVKFGGVPVIKPGFDYTYEIIDEKNEALPVFLKRYPNFQTPITVQLMK